MTSPPNRLFYEFGAFRLDTEKQRLLRNGQLVSLTPKAVETLRVLIERAGQLVPRSELMNSVWPDVAVEDGNLSVAVSMLRKALGEEGTGEKYIDTVPRLGYVFVAEVKKSFEPAPTLIVEKQTLTRVVVDDQVHIGNTQRSSWRSAFSAKVYVAALAVVVVIAGAYLMRRGRSEEKPAAGNARIQTMAVLPFVLLNTNTNDEYLGLGLADALITRLSNVRQLVVRPTSSILKYKSSEDPLVAGREMKVDAVLEGTMQNVGDHFRITVRLISIQSGSTVWASTFDEKTTDLLAMQDSISEQVTQALSLNISNNEKALLTKRYTDNVEAYQAYTKGRYFWNKRTRPGLRQSVDYFKQALDLDPTYALAYAGLADAYALLVWQGEFQQSQFVPKAKAAATRALELDDTLAEAHTSLGFVKLWYEWDFSGAEAEYRRAIELNVNYATAHHWYGELLTIAGRFDEGARELHLAQMADPLSVVVNVDIGKMFFFSRQSDRAIDQLRETLKLDPEFPLGHLFLGMSYNQKGMTEEAIKELQTTADRTGGFYLIKAVLAYVLARSGRTTEATAILNELKELRIPAFQIALIYAGLGNKDESFAWLEKSFSEHDPFLVYIKADPNFEVLQSDARFSELLDRMHYPRAF